MKVLVIGRDELLARVRNQAIGQNWELYHANSASDAMDYADTHSFQGALVDLCANDPDVLAGAKVAKNLLKVPVIIGLAANNHPDKTRKASCSKIDIVLSDCGNDPFIKLQCDALVRLANNLQGETITLIRPT